MGPNELALEATIEASQDILNDRHAALLSLCRLLAKQVDEGGAGVSTRLTAAYLSALKDLSRIIQGAAPRPAMNELARIRASRGLSSVPHASRMV